MSSPVERDTDTSRFAIERDLAPHVDERWAESFLLELRLLAVAGDRVGAALSEVESHCVDSSDSAQEAFGDPVEYARSLDLPVQAEPSGLARLSSVAPSLLEVVGMLVLLWSFTAWRRGEPLDLTGGQLITLAVGMVSMVAVVHWSDTILRLVVQHPVWLWCAFMAATAAYIVPLVLVDGTVARLGTPLPMGLGTTALFGGLVWEWARHNPADPITSPLDAAPTSAPHVGRRTATPLREIVQLVLIRGTVPLWTLVMLAVTAWFTR